MGIAIFVIIFAGIVFKIDYQFIKKNAKSPRDRIIYTIFSFLALSITLLFILDVPIPNPNEGIKWIYQPFAEPLRNSLVKYLNQ